MRRQIPPEPIQAQGSRCRSLARSLSAAVLAVALAGPAAGSQGGPIRWQDWTPETFAQAREAGRLILLDLVAVWCHWCHVMDSTTYRDPAVVAAIQAHYVPVQVDHDARPDLAERYRHWGWPATIVLTANGQELEKRAGYIEPAAMAALLGELAAAPRSPGGVPAPARLSAEPFLGPETKAELERRHLDTYDPELGGLRQAMKFIDRDALRWDLRLATAGGASAARRARQTLDAALALLDPAFGGFYQYSTHGDWAHPHFEKIMSTQADYLAVYTQAYRQFGDARYLAAARATAAYLTEFLSAPDGSFYTSQDADLVPGEKGTDYFALDRAGRLARGLPRVDRHSYARENGWATAALAELYRADGDLETLRRALAAAHWALRERSLPGGGFRHDARDSAGPYLGDTLAMGRAFLALYQATRDRAWLTRAQQAAGFIDMHFRQPGGGLLAAVDNGTPVKPLPQIDENIAAARFALALAAESESGDVGALDLARHTLRYLATPEVAEARLTEAGVLLADAELRDLAGQRPSVETGGG